MKVLVLTKYPEKGPSSRYRFHQYFPGLRRCGATLKIRPFFSQHYLDKLFSKETVGVPYLVWRCLIRTLVCLTNLRADVVWVEGELLPFFPAWLERILHKTLPKRRVYDFDDAVWFRYRHRPKLADKYLAILKDADHVIAGNDYLADYVGQATSRITVLPTVIDGERYKQIEATLEGKVIGWIGSPTTVFFLESLRPVFQTLAQRQDFELHVVGANLDWQGIKVVNWPWSESTELERISAFDVGIMPLDGSEWAKGKCGLKLIQYMAAGVPAIASPVGVNPWLIQQSGGGLLAEGEDQWLTSLSKLLEEESLRRDLGAKGRAWTLRHLTVESRTGTLAGVLKGEAANAFNGCGMSS